MYLKHTLFVLLVIIPIFTWGQRNLIIAGSVEDYVTHHPIPESSVALLSADSMVLDSTTAKGMLMSNGQIVERYANFYLKIPKEGKYLIRVQKEEYDTRYIPINISQIHNREIERKIAAIYLQRAIALDLNEVTITATKVKFYNKGDTLVYNADAFRLAEGSMLDALIRQLPGAEIKSDGRIYVNGKFVENLLLNGKDFFKGNNQVMLDNLPTYMVSTVKVYDKAGNLSEFIGRDTGDKATVMDVQLKKQYNTAWIGNIEGGGGTDSRFLGRLFAMRFTDHSQLSVYGNINNTNDVRKPGQDTDWSPEKMPTGLLTTRLAGLDYSINDRNKRFKLNGNAQFKHTDDDIRINTNTTNFLPGGDTYDRLLNTSRNSNIQMGTYHKFYFKFDRFDLDINPQFNYHKYNSKGSRLSATSSTNWTFFSKEQLDSLYTPTLAESLKERLLNRNLQLDKGNGYDWNGGMSASSTIKMKYSPDALTLSANIAFKGAGNDAFNQSQIDYLSEKPISTDFRNQYYRNKPGKESIYSLKASYLYWLSQAASLTFHYTYNKNYTFSSRSLYRIDRLNGWGEGTEHEIGELPSMNEYLNTLDPNNSYASKFYDNVHEVGAFLNWSVIKEGKCMWWAQVNIPLAFHNQQLKYQRASLDTTLNRRTVLPNINSTFIQWQTLDRKHKVNLSYSLKSEAPDMTYLVDVKDDSNPLNIINGNPHLKNSFMHGWNLNYNNNRSDKQRQIGVYLSYALTQKALAMGYIYDRATGARTVTPDNVNGNWNGSLQVYYSSPIDKKRLFTFSNNLSGIYTNNVDLIGTNNMSKSNRSVVKTSNLTETFKVDYKLCQHMLSAKAGVVWTHANSDREDFTTINAVNYNYGIIAQLKLPWKFKLDTDISMYSRRGYEDHSLNSDDLVWNARLTRPVLKGRLVLAADGFDILNQLTNVRRTLNAQGRTEVRTNVIPRYVMLHATYRLNIMPKKKK